MCKSGDNSVGRKRVRAVSCRDDPACKRLGLQRPLHVTKKNGNDPAKFGESWSEADVTERLESFKSLFINGTQCTGHDIAGVYGVLLDGKRNGENCRSGGGRIADLSRKRLADRRNGGLRLRLRGLALPNWYQNDKIHGRALLSFRMSGITTSTLLALKPALLG